MFSVDDPGRSRALRPGRRRALDLGEKKPRHITTPHVPHRWETDLVHDETTSTSPVSDAFDLGEKKLRYITTPHVLTPVKSDPVHDEITSTSRRGEVFTQLGDGPMVSYHSPMRATIAAEDALGYSASAPNTVPGHERSLPTLALEGLRSAGEPITTGLTRH